LAIRREKGLKGVFLLAVSGDHSGFCGETKDSARARMTVSSGDIM
jgi:hypothetical protein